MEELDLSGLVDADDAGTARSSPKSLPDFQRVFPNEEACRTYIYTARFPNGFVCPYCGWTGKPYRFRNQWDMQRCRDCKRNTRLTAS